jgi:hypothetical protein
MPYFLIRHGLSGGFGGAVDDYISDFVDEEEATDVAYECAVEDYQSQEGSNGLRSYDDILEEESDEDLADEIYQEEMDSWLDFNAVEVVKMGETWCFAETGEVIELDSNTTIYE